jgi:chitinase
MRRYKCAYTKRNNCTAGAGKLSAGAAGSGHISNDNLQRAFTILEQQYPGMRGIMTWSINWDVFQNNNSFAQSNGAFLSRFE